MASLEESLQLQEILKGLPCQWVYKASFDKANRTSAASKRGVGLSQGLELLSLIKEALGVPVLTDVHLPDQCTPVAEVVDILQIPAFLCRQTDLLLAAADTGKTINLKKGQFLSPADFSHACKKITEQGNADVLLTERGSTFGHGGLVVDFTGLPVMQKTGHPVILDATHAVQQPGSGTGITGGNWKMAPLLLRAGAAAGFDGYFVETHLDPQRSPSDAANMIPFSALREVIEETLEIHAVHARHTNR